jgi:murein DD-endopeptidase MepM/ murein hydrolase activator NlpD
MGKVSYYDQSGNSVERLFLRSPLKYTRISSNYTNRRKHPILKNYTPHRAIDYAAPIGTPVHAIGDGKVIFAGKKGANGNLVVIQHQDGFQSYYAHLSKFAKGLKVGSEVSRRSFIGEVGSTGRSTGPHLHFAVAKNGSFVHPRTLLQVKGPSLDADLMSDFSVSVAKATARLKSTLIRGDEATKSY